MFCNNCGNNCRDGLAFCTNCGSRLSSLPHQAQPSFVPPQVIYVQQVPVQEVNKPKNPGFVLSIPAMISGIISIVDINILFGIAGIIMSAISMAKGKKSGVKNGMAIAGLVCSIIGTVIGATLIVLLVLSYIGAIQDIYSGSFSQF
ncbi:MAG: hypothetical protein E7384_03665 [Ruminococcaceae bacterium]|nr:hypothetical protein [Oscillospiraceae bacterium]